MGYNKVPVPVGAELGPAQPQLVLQFCLAEIQKEFKIGKLRV